MFKHAIVTVSSVLVLAGNIVWAQGPDASSDPGNMTRFSKAISARYTAIKRDIVEAADAVPEAEYSFRPTPQVRTFAQLVGHIADAQNFFCGIAAGSNPEYSDANEKGAATKADAVKALKESVEKCDAAYSSTTASNALELVKAGKGDALRGMMLIDNVSHDNEHYGNIVTYMRLKGHVPPSTARTMNK